MVEKAAKFELTKIRVKSKHPDIFKKLELNSSPLKGETITWRVFKYF